MSTYVVRAEVADKQLQALVTDDYLADTDLYIQNLALRLGLTVAQIKSPLTFTAKKLAIAYLCTAIARDNIGINIQAQGYGADIDLYKSKWKTWSAEFERLEPQVSAEVLTGDADTPEEFASGSIPLFRR